MMIIFKHEISRKKRKEGYKESCQMFAISYLYFITFEYASCVNSNEHTFKKNAKYNCCSIEKRTI